MESSTSAGDDLTFRKDGDIVLAKGKSVVAHTCHLSTLEAEAGGSGAEG